MKISINDLTCRESHAIVASQPGTLVVVKFKSGKEANIPVIAWKFMKDGRCIPILVGDLTESEDENYGEKINIEVTSIIFNEMQQQIYSVSERLNINDWVSDEFQSVIAPQPGTYAIVSFANLSSDMDDNEVNESDRIKMTVPVIAWKVMNDGRTVPVLLHGRIHGSPRNKENYRWIPAIDSNDIPDGGKYMQYEIVSFVFNCTEEQNWSDQ